MPLCILILAICCPALAEVIDRVAVAVDNSVVTTSEIERQLRVAAFLNGEKPDLSPDKRRDMADKLVEQALIRREIRLNRFNTDPGPAVAELYGNVTKRYGGPEGYARALTEYGIRDDDVRGALEWQLQLLDFIEVRFRPGVQVPEAEIKDYYERIFAAQARQSAEGVPSYEEARGRIEQVLSQRLVDNALDRWLGQARTQSRITYRKEAFE